MTLLYRYWQILNAVLVSVWYIQMETGIQNQINRHYEHKRHKIYLRFQHPDVHRQYLAADHNEPCQGIGCGRDQNIQQNVKRFSLFWLSFIIVYHLGFSGIPLNTVNIVVIIHDKPSLFYNISLNFEKFII